MDRDEENDSAPVNWNEMDPEMAAELQDAIAEFRAAVEILERAIAEEERLEAAQLEEIENLPAIPDCERLPLRPF